VQQLYSRVFIHGLGNVFTEPLPSNDRGGTHVDTQTRKTSKQTTDKLLQVVFLCVTTQSYIGRTTQDQVSLPCGGGVEYLHRRPASRRRRLKGNPVPGCITGPPCSWGIK
jgi:hypothetical protein